MKRVMFLCVLAAFVATGPHPARADEGGSSSIEDNLSSYTGANAEGYLKPLQTALGQTLNSGVFIYAGVPRDGITARLEIKAMVTSFGDDDRTFTAVTEDYFGEPRTAVAPTVVGSGEAASVTDPSTGAVFYFPGGFDLKHFGLAVPQVTVGSVLGTEAVGRYIKLDTGDNEIGDIKLVGLGGRHSISNWLQGFPVDLSAMIFWQRLEIGKDFIESTALTYGVQAGRSAGIASVYGGLSVDSIDLDVTYTSDAGSEDPTEIQVEFDKESTLHLALGATLRLGFLHLNGEFNRADQTSFTLGLGLGQ